MSALNSQSFTSLAKALLLCACISSLTQAIAQSAAPADGAAPIARQAPASPTPTMAVPLPTSPMSAATAAEIQKINENMTLLQAQLNQLELKAKIASKQKEISGTSADSVQSSFDSKNGNPSVVAVVGLKGHLEATLIFPGGVTQRVREGDLIDDRRVTKVALNEVVLTDLKGKNVQRLAFGSTPLTRERTALQAGVNGQTTPMMPAIPATLPGQR